MRWTQDELAEVAEGVLASIDIEEAVKAEAPVDTGALRASIRVVDAGKRASIQGLGYGAIQNARGRHEGWIERGIDKAVEEANDGS